MARNGEWDSLVDYCMDDVRLTVQLCERNTIRLFEHIDGFWVCCEYPTQANCRNGEAIRFYCEAASTVEANHSQPAA